MPTIRKATLKDASQINKITKAAFTLYKNELSSNIKVDALLETDADILFDIKNNTVFVAEENGVILGAIRYSFLNKTTAYIYRFSVDPSSSSTGFGSCLLKAALDDAKEKGAVAVTLYTNAKYFTLARYYYGKEFFVHSTDNSKGYIRALFIKELVDGAEYDLGDVLRK